VEDAVKPGRVQEPIGARGERPEDEPTTAASGAMVRLDEQPEAGGIADLRGAGWR